MLGVFKKAAAASFIFLAACAQEPQLGSSLASSLAVTSVTATSSVSRENTALPKGEIVEAARRKVEANLRSINPGGSRPVVAQLDVKRFYIANPAAGALLGSSSSSIAVDVRLVDADTGAVVKDTFEVFGTTEARPTVFGAAAIKSPREELNIITDDLAQRVSIAVYGNIASGI